ncbi:pPIWI_RE_Y domain-containing protein [Streptomyces sp. NPDC004838]
MSPEFELLAAVARGVLDLSDVTRPTALRLPYPANTQLAFDRVVLSFLQQDQPPPLSVPELLSRCRDLLSTWPLALPPDVLTYDARLIDQSSAQPTRTCAELSSYGRLGRLEQGVAQVIADLADASGAPERFATCRDFLITHPVILNPDVSELMRPNTIRTWRLVRELYEPAPEHFSTGPTVSTCTECLLFAKSAAGDGAWCEGGCTKRRGGLEKTEEPKRPIALPRAVRLFLALPGRTELALRKKLPGGSQLIPTGTGGLRFVHRDGTGRAIRVLDREQPALAAFRSAELAALEDTPLDVVMPDAVVARPGYRKIFDHSLPDGARVRLRSVSEFTAPHRSDPPGRTRA